MESLPPSASARLFFALWPDERVRNALVASQAAWRWTAGAAVQPAEKLHLTLHFLGAVERALLGGLLESVAVPMPRFTLRLPRVALWPKGVAVMESDTPPGLQSLRASLEARLTRLGLVPDAREYRPHVTLARRAAGSVPPSEPGEICWDVQHFVLAESSAGQYRILRRWPVDP